MLFAMAGNTYGITASCADAFPVTPETAPLAILLLDVAYGAQIAAMLGAAVPLFALWRAALTEATETAAVVPVRLAWIGFAIAALSLTGPVSTWVTPMLLAVWLVVAGLRLALKKI
jgi:hypothetical protein